MTTKTWQKTSKTEKYLDALNELYTICSYTDSFSITEFKRTNHLPGEFIEVAIKAGLIRNEGRTNASKFYWNTIRPNKHMAKKLHDEISKLVRQRNNKSVGEEQKVVVNTLKKRPVTNNLSVTENKKLVGWRGQIGFIKFSLTPIYK